MNKEREISLICEEKDIMLMKKIRESLEKYISIRFAFKEVLNYSFIAWYYIHNFINLRIKNINWDKKMKKRLWNYLSPPPKSNISILEK